MRLERPRRSATEEAELRAWLRIVLDGAALGGVGVVRPRWLRRAGRHVNNKRIRRLWRDEGLRVPQRRRKKRLVGIGIQVGAFSPIRPNVVWAMDFPVRHHRRRPQIKTAQRDRRIHPRVPGHRGRPLDRCRPRRRGARPARPAAWRAGVRPLRQRPEFVAHAVDDWCRFNAPGRCSSIPARPGRTPGSRASTADSATNSSTRWRFDSLLEARVIIEDWRLDYNAERPHTAHGDLTPTEFALRWNQINQPQAA